MTTENSGPKVGPVELARNYVRRIPESLVNFGSTHSRLTIYAIGLTLMYTTNAPELKSLLIAMVKERFGRKRNP